MRQARCCHIKEPFSDAIYPSTLDPLAFLISLRLGDAYCWTPNAMLTIDTRWAIGAIAI